eukprot:1145624-Pelagomonas_calceolata.AAC.3
MQNSKVDRMLHQPNEHLCVQQKTVSEAGLVGDTVNGTAAGGRGEGLAQEPTQDPEGEFGAFYRAVPWGKNAIAFK